MTSWRDKIYGTPEGRRALDRERVLFEATERISTLMERDGVSRAELARRLGVSGARVTQMLRGTNNFSLGTLAEVYFALGRSLHVYDGPAGDRLRVPDDGDVVELSAGDWNETNTVEVSRAPRRLRVVAEPAFAGWEGESGGAGALEESMWVKQA